MAGYEGWADRAEDELGKDLEEGLITMSEYRAGLLDIRNEYYEQRHDAEQEAYDNY